MTDFRDEEILVHAAGKTVRCLLRTPQRLAKDPWLLINLSMDCRHSLAYTPYAIAANAFLDAGHRAVGMDLPKHGASVDAFGEGLEGIAAAMRVGNDVFADFRAGGRVLVDRCIKRRLTSARRIVAAGTSRGGLFALHLAAADPRIVGVAVFAPVTRLGHLTEFATQADHPLVMRNSADALVEQLRDKPMFIAINDHDERVGSEHALAFVDRLRRADERSEMVLWTAPEQSHRLPDAGYDAGADFLLSLCRRPRRSK